jgi:hypothetical protein
MDEDDFRKTPHVTLLGSLTGHEAPVTAMAWSPDEQWLASTSHDGVLNLWSRIRPETTPRFSRRSEIRPTPTLTSVAWSPDGKFLACGSTAGQLLIWDASGFRAVAHNDDRAKSAINCVRWGVGPGPDDRRLAFGEQDKFVQFRNYRNWTRPDTERAFGHASAILSVAWSPDGGVVVTGTEDGTIGVWRPSERNNELAALLTRSGIHAHIDEAEREGKPVTALAFCPRTGVLASGGQDGYVCLWDLADDVFIERLAVEPHEEILDLAFGHNGEVILVRSLHHIRVVRRDPLREVGVFYYPTAAFALSASSRLATVEVKDRSTIKVWTLDFDALLKRSDLRPRVYRAAAVSLLGEPGSGRTNLALALTGATFVREHTSHEFQVHRLAVTDGAGAAEAEETREVALWDLPTRVDHALVHRVHAGDGAVALMVLSPVPGTQPAAAKNLAKWARTLRRWHTISRGQRHPSIVVIAKADEFARECSPVDAEAIAQHLKVDKVMIVSAKRRIGIQALRDDIVKAIDWSAATSFPSRDVLDVLVDFVGGLRAKQRYLTSTGELYELFVHLHPYVTALVPGEEVFMQGVQLLEVLGQVELFKSRKEVVLDSRFYHAYASAMITRAESDETGMGRLPLLEAESGRGLSLEETERLDDRSQEEKLLALTINELVVCGVAQKVATDGASHLVFPISLTRVRDDSEPRPAQVAAFRFVGPTDEVFSSLIVRLLGLKNYYSKPELWKNEALFAAASGGLCGVVLEPNELGDEARLSVHCDGKTNQIERRQFLDMVCEHIDTLGRIVSSEAVEGEPPPEIATPGVSEAAGQAGRVEVFLCWKGSTASRMTAENVRAIAAQLRDRGIHTVGDVVRDAGVTPEEHWSRIERSRVALVLAGGALSTQQEIDYKRLEDHGCRIIPVILPNAPRQFALPAALLQWQPIDLRGRLLADPNQLADAVTRAWLNGPVPAKMRGHVFLSYSGTDVDQIDHLRQELERSGHAVWWDRGDAELTPGQPWPEDIKQAIWTSYAFLWCVSDGALKRSQSWFYRELSEAIEMQRDMHPARVFIIPVRLSECDIPEARIDAMRSIGQLQRFDYFERRGNIAGLVRVLDKARRQASGSPSPDVAVS